MPGRPGPGPAGEREQALILACEQAATGVLDAGYPLVSVYLQSGDTLRCYAVHGYRQLFDGIGPDSGIIGTVWQTGTAVELSSPETSPAYRRAVDGVVAEVCVPVRLDGRTVGVVNAETTTAVAPGAPAAVARAAEALGRRLTELGGPPPPSADQLLLGHAQLLAEADRPSDVAAAFLAAAQELTGMSSAVLLIGTPPRPVAEAGPLAHQLAAADVAALTAVDAWVAHGGSSRTADLDGVELAGQLALDSAGAACLLLLSVGRGRERLGSLLLADAQHRGVGPRTVGTLELLAALAAANLRTATAVQRLRHRAETDPLTGLGHRDGFDEAVRRATDAVEPHGQQVAVLAFDLDGFKQINDTAGHAAGDEALRLAARCIASALREGDGLYRLGGDEFAAVLVVHGQDEAVAVGTRVLEACRARAPVTVSVGVALAQHGEDGRSLVSRADRALYASKAGGRDRVTEAPLPQVGHQARHGGTCCSPPAEAGGPETGEAESD